MSSLCERSHYLKLHTVNGRESAPESERASSPPTVPEGEELLEKKKCSVISIYLGLLSVFKYFCNREKDVEILKRWKGISISPEPHYFSSLCDGSEFLIQSNGFNYFTSNCISGPSFSSGLHIIDCINNALPGNTYASQTPDTQNSTTHLSFPHRLCFSS